MPALPSLRHPQPWINARIYEALFKAREQEPPRLRLSRIGECERKLWALLKGWEEDPIDPYVLAIFETGKALEGLVLSLLELGGLPVRDRQLEVKLTTPGGHEVLGHIDGTTLLGERLRREMVVIEVKTAKAEQFAKCVELGYAAWQPKYADTLTCYMGGLGLRTALVCVLNKNTSELYFEKLRFDAKRYAALQGKIDRILSAETLPARPAEATSQYCNFCKYCSLRESCWGPLQLGSVRFDA